MHINLECILVIYTILSIIKKEITENIYIKNRLNIRYNDSHERFCTGTETCKK